MVDEEPPKLKRTLSQKPKERTRMYHLCKNGERVRVCQKFFLAVLNISSTMMTTALSKKQSSTITASYQQGVKSPGNKTTEHALQNVMDHISSFPTLPSHYSRRDTTKQYLEGSLNITKMYELYVEDCKEKGREPVKRNIYRDVFTTRFNIGFHKPAKDSCLQCDKFKAGIVSQEEHDKHIAAKERARQEKETDKKHAKQSNNIHTCTFDLQQVLSCPNTSTSTVFYKRKLSVYNLSVYSLGTKQGTCYVWDETSGKRGAAEIGTALHTYLSSLPSMITHVNLFSDCCSGQNKNKYTATALIYSMKNNANLTVLDQKYLTSGHTAMEVDSIHSAIETAKKQVSVYVPENWNSVIQLARRKHPFAVVPVRIADILHVEKMFEAVSYLANVPWKQVKWVRYVKDGDDVQVMYKIDYDGEFQTPGRKAETRQSRKPAIPLVNYKKYSGCLPISAEKKADLLSLCRDGTIPAVYHDFYKRLETCSDQLVVSDSSEED